MKIIGAGLAGLIAANIFPQARIIEAQGRDKLDHKALLRFRSTAVAEATGIEFRKVRVHKGIWHEGEFAQPNVQLANFYSQKVIGSLADRSIWNLDPAERYIAPEDFIGQLIENCGDRIEWGTRFDLGIHKLNKEPAISTMPMSVLHKIIDSESLQLADKVSEAFQLPKKLVLPTPEFKHKEITVGRWRIPGADVFQTIYFTQPENPVYRASITGDMLIVEAMGEIGDWLESVVNAFGVDQLDEIGAVKQSFGKIAPIDDAWRRNFILRASVDHGIYSVGRFATWRNIMLDDVVHDLSVVKRLIKVGNNYFNHIKS
jgi:hypothetical protein